MNWFQKFWGNPNVHILGAMAAGAASVAFPAYAAPLQIVSGVLGSAAVLTPEAPGQAVLPDKPAAPPAPVITLPPAASGGSYHAVDYANLAAAILAQFAQKPSDPPATPKA